MIKKDMLNDNMNKKEIPRILLDKPIKEKDVKKLTFFQRNTKKYK